MSLAGTIKRLRTSWTDALSEEIAAILALAWPTAMAAFSWTAMLTVDMVILGHIGQGEVAALAGARSVVAIIVVTGISLLSGIMPHIAWKIGANDWAGVASLYWSSLVLAVAVSICGTAILLILPTELMGIFGVSSNLSDASSTVIVAMAFGYPAHIIGAAISCSFEGISRPRTVTLVTLCALPFNALLAWAWATGRLPWLPHRGATAAAAATSAISWINASILFFIAMKRCGRPIARTEWHLASYSLSLLKFAFLPTLAAMLQLAGISRLIGHSTALGNGAAAAFQIVLSVQSLIAIIAMGFASAAGVRIGMVNGAADYGLIWYRTGVALGMCCFAHFVAIVVCATNGASIAALFTADAAVRSIAAPALILLIPFLFFDAVHAVLAAALRSLGKQMSAGWNTIFAYFVVIVTVGEWSFKRGNGLYGLVVALAAGIVVGAILQAFHLLKTSSALR